MKNRKSSIPFIKKVHLKGYKSILDLEVNLCEGLNIIIGSNGSGKTNFVEFLENTLSFTNNFKQSYECKIEVESSRGETILEEYFNREYKNDIKIPIFKTLINQEQVENGKLSSRIRNYSDEENPLYRLFDTKNLPFTIPKEFGEFMLQKLGSIVFPDDNFNFKILEGIFEHEITFEKLKPFLGENFVAYSNRITAYLCLNKSLVNNLKEYTPIQDLRLSDGLSIGKENGTVIKINYIMLEFFVNGQWLSWEQLSDGTKRIFYIIYEINNALCLILLEEPENGVHPDQLYKLMDFIKVQSKKKQIIMTTHAPEVLNILEKDELDRIIVTHFDQSKGTKMYHLSEKQKAKSIWYMENKGMLSDCWVHTNSFEKLEEPIINV